MSTETIKTIGQLKKSIRNLKDDAKLFINDDGLLYSFWQSSTNEDKKVVADSIGLIRKSENDI